MDPGENTPSKQMGGEGRIATQGGKSPLSDPANERWQKAPNSSVGYEPLEEILLAQLPRLHQLV